MKNMKNYYGLTGVLCVALIGGLVSSVTKADDKVRAEGHILVTNNAPVSFLCAYVPTKNDSAGRILEAPEDFNGDAIAFARQPFGIRIHVVRAGEKHNVLGLPEKGDFGPCLWIAAATRQGHKALHNALYNTGELALFAPVQAVPVDGSYVNVELGDQNGPLKSTVRGKLVGSVANYLGNTAEAVSGTLGEAKDTVFAYGELTAEKIQTLFGAAKDYVKEKAQVGVEKGKQKAHEVAEKGRSVAREARVKMTIAEAGKAIGLTPDKIRKLEDNKTLTKKDLKVLVAEIRASIEKAKIDGKKNAAIAGAALEEHFEYVQNALNS